MATIRLKLTRDEAKAVLRQVPGLLAGKVADSTGLLAPLMRAVGVEALSIIKQAFIAKARGGTDEAGIVWRPLSREYVAYKRRHPGLPPAKQRAAKHPSWMLNEAQRELWKKTFGRTFHALVREGVAEGEAKGIAAGKAWRVVKAAGGQTILGEYGNTKVEIGRDTGRLLNSLGPVETGNPDVLLAIEQGAVRVGTNVEYAGYFHKVRPMWPEGDWPATWTGRLEDTVADGLGLLLQEWLKRGAAA